MRVKITIPDAVAEFIRSHPTLSCMSVSGAVRHLILTHQLWLGGDPSVGNHEAEGGAPMPGVQVSGVGPKLRSLEVGNSVVIERDANNVSAYCAYYRRKHGRKFTVHTVEPGIVRVWRVE